MAKVIEGVFVPGQPFVEVHWPTVTALEGVFVPSWSWENGYTTPANTDHPMTFLPSGESGPYTCPVCNGTGTMPAAFYNRDAVVTTHAWPDQECRSCNGTGVIWR